MKLTLQESKWPPPEDTILEAKISNVEQREAPFTDDTTGQPAQRISFEFRIADPEVDFEGRIWGETPTTFNTNPNCKLRAWAQEILGGTELEKDYVLDTDDLIDRPCRVVTALRPGKDRDGNPVTRPYVKDVLRSRVARPASIASAPRRLTSDEERPF